MQRAYRPYASCTISISVPFFIKTIFVTGKRLNFYHNMLNFLISQEGESKTSQLNKMKIKNNIVVKITTELFLLFHKEYN